MQYAHWLMVAGAVLVVLGFIGLALHKNEAGTGRPSRPRKRHGRRRGNERKPIFQERTETGIPLVFVGIASLHDYRLSLRATLGLKAKK